MTGRKTSTRIGDAERAAAQHALQEHLNAGRLQVNEYADRCASAANATTASELAALFEDLPAPHPKLPGMSDSALGAILRNRVLVAAAAVLVLAGLALVIGLSGRSDPLPPPWTAAGPTPPAVPPTSPVTAPTASATSVPATPTDRAALPGNVTVRRTSQPNAITLRPSYGVDLDDNTSPNWGVKSAPVGAGYGGSDIGSDSYGDIVFIGDYAVVTGAPEYATCATETAYTSGGIERGSLRPDENICLRTSEDRFALVTIISTSEQAIQFRATVWDPPVPS